MNSWYYSIKDLNMILPISALHVCIQYSFSTRTKLISVCDMQNNFISFTCPDKQTLICLNVYVIFLVWRWSLYIQKTRLIAWRQHSSTCAKVACCMNNFFYTWDGGGCNKKCPNNCLVALLFKCRFQFARSPFVRLACDIDEAC